LRLKSGGICAGAVIVLLAIAVLGGASGSSAGLSIVSTKSYLSTDPTGHVCPAFDQSERHYCVVVTVYNGLASKGGVEVDLTMQNFDQSTLSNPSSVLTWLPAGANLTFVSSSTSTCSFRTSDSSVGCTFPNIPGVGSGSGTGNPPPSNSATIKLFFTANADDGVSSVHFHAIGTAKESNNDNGGAANVEQQTVEDAPMTFGSDPTQSATVSLGGKHQKLNALLNTYNGSTDSVEFDVPAGTSPFLAQFQAGQGSTTCFGGITCTGLQLTTDVSGAPIGTFSSGNQILWRAVINSTSTNVVAFHYYDPVSVTASPSTLTSSTSFAACDGVNFATAPTGLDANKDYFVVNATATSFQVATSAKGKPLTFTGSGTFQASCIREIGDDNKTEKLSSCAAGSKVPALYAEKLSSGTVLVCLADVGNGLIKY
jgi:hypothetical protein